MDAQIGPWRPQDANIVDPNYATQKFLNIKTSHFHLKIQDNFIIAALKRVEVGGVTRLPPKFFVVVHFKTSRLNVFLIFVEKKNQPAKLLF